MDKHFGPHLMIDACKCDYDKLISYEFVYELLDRFPDNIGMTKMTLPHVVKWVDKGSSVPGISGFIMIAESHISIHTFPEKDYVFIDIFSCRNFDVEKTKELFINAFGAEQSTVNVVKRGIDFPRAEIVQ